MARNALLSMTVPDDEWRMTRAVNALGFGPMTQATQAGRQNALLSSGMPAARPNDYMAPVAETISPTMGAYGAGQMAAEGSRAIGQGDYMSGGAGLALGMAGMIPGAPKGKGIRAFHGSPHDFDRFDMSKIGTGEGAQAYGHGLYFAESEGVARSYRDGLSKWNPTIDGKPVIEMWGDGTLHTTIAEMTGLSIADAQSAGNWVADAVRSGKPLRQVLDEKVDAARRIYPADIAEGEVQRINAIGEKIATLAPETFKGRMYEVRINADPEDFLDWDKPLSQQSERVRGVVDRMRGASSMVDRKIAVDPRGQAIWEAMRNGFIGKKFGYEDWSTAGPTKALREAGIPGIKYLDQGSRGAGDGSRNYVVFRDDIIEIVKKYGLAAAVSTYGFDAVRGAMEDQQQ